MGDRALKLSDISDLREYEREREEFRRSVIALKKRRRVGIGPFVTVLFENRTTVRFQVQEMARAERMLSDEQIQAELDIYNPLIPRRGELSFTLFLELRTDAELREWLPRLVGIERAVELRFGSPPGDTREAPETVSGRVEAGHESQLTRDEVTASVHYVNFELSKSQQARFSDVSLKGPVTIAVAHENYRYEAELSPDIRRSLAEDWE
ncbi:MAG: DUF3501 family protein [Acidimicrobiales bacterium]